MRMKDSTGRPYTSTQRERRRDTEQRETSRECARGDRSPIGFVSEGCYMRRPSPKDVSEITLGVPLAPQSLQVMSGSARPDRFDSTSCVHRLHSVLGNRRPSIGRRPQIQSESPRRSGVRPPRCHRWIRNRPERNPSLSTGTRKCRRTRPHRARRSARCTQNRRFALNTLFQSPRLGLDWNILEHSRKTVTDFTSCFGNTQTPTPASHPSFARVPCVAREALRSRGPHAAALCRRGPL